MVAKNKSVLIFSAYTLPHLGGIERYVDNLAREMVKSGVTPVVVTSNFDGSAPDETIDGVRILRLPVFNLFKNRYPIFKLNKTRRELLKKLDAYDFNAVIVNTRFHLSSHIGANYGKKRSIPAYLVEHGSNYVTLDNKFIDFFANRYEDFLTWKIKKKIKGFYGVSLACNEWLSRLGITASGVWYNSIDTSIMNLPRREKHFGTTFMYAGRMLKQKGVDNVLEAFTNLNYKDTKLYIAGDGPELETYKKKYNNKNIEYLGYLEYEELLGYYAKTDVFIYPPLWPEGSPTALLEAGMMGCAVIGTNQGGIKEIIDDKENGIIVETTAKSLQNAMKALVDDPKLVQKYAAALKKTVIDKFSWDLAARKILEDIKK